jgi:nicotinate dehydrogenase subunit B
VSLRETGLTKHQRLARASTLIVLRGAVPESDSPDRYDEDVEIFVEVAADGGVTAFNGHVDLGTGIRTALAQIVAEELDVAFDRVTMVLGDTASVPNQGPTIASETIQITAVPLRAAAATARRFLLARAAEVLEADPADLAVEDGLVRLREGNRHTTYAELVAGQSYRVALDHGAPVKAVDSYRVVGQAVARVDIPAKATGEFTFVHDARIPGMLHGRVVRPPYAGIDAGDLVGHAFVSLDESSVADIPGFVAVVQIRDFVGVVAEREEHAVLAAERLRVTWRQPPDLPDLNRPEGALRANPSVARTLLDRGDTDAALAGAATAMTRTYVWPYQMHASIGPSCSLADVRPDGVKIWSGTQNPHPLQADIARLLDRPAAEIEIIRLEAAGCYGRNCADDVGADAALLSRAVGRPVRVQLSREQEHLWEPKGAAQVMDVAGGLDAEGGVAAYDYASRYPSNGAPTLALLLTGTIPNVPLVFEMGDRTAIPPYAYDNARVTIHDMPPIVRASWFRGVSALPSTFAHESWIDEAASSAKVDPIEYRLRYLQDERAIALVQAVSARAAWQPHTQPHTLGGEGDLLFGRGFAYALYVHSKFPGYGAAWSAWVADVAVNKATGEVAVTRVVVGQDSGLMINPAGIRHQIHGNVIQSTSRALKEQVTFDRVAVTSREWGGYPIVTFPEVPAIDVVMLPRPYDPPLGGGESASVPSAAAIANAIYDATGVRFRELPFTAERVRAALNPGAADAAASAPPPTQPRTKTRRRWFGLAAAALTGALGMGGAILPWRSAFAPITRPDPSVYSAATIERGRLVAAIGNCIGCHTGPDGVPFAGGHVLDTPFGRIIATNITPDPVAGIGAWSYPAFERAMREGVSRDGHFLYPAHPYTGFTKASDADLQALYAYLVAQPASAATPPKTELAFPFNLRPLMAGWNALFLRPGAYMADPAQSEAWNRGAYLVEGLGHCGACHTPRNALGAERRDAALAGAFADGWEAPALTSLSRAPIPWSEAELFAYLRTGTSRHHGVAAGPMAPVVAELGALPDADIRAMAVYLASFNAAPPNPATEEAQAAALHEATREQPALQGSPGSRIFAGACAVCHEVGAGPKLFGAKPSLALNTNVHSDAPDNLIRVVLAGIANPAHPDLGAMPGFGASLDDAQIVDLLRYIRARFAPGRPAWDGLADKVAGARAGH